MLTENAVLLNQDYLQPIFENRVSVASSKRAESERSASDTRSEYLVPVVIFIVVCLHVAVLLVMLRHPSVVAKKVSLPTIVGILIQTPSTELKEVPKSKAIVKSAPKKLSPRPKKVSSAEKTVTLPEPIVDEPDLLDEPSQEQLAPIVSPRSDASHLNNRAPVYPRASLRRHEEGKVVLELLIRADGTVGEVRIKESSGHPRLDNAALKAVKHWHYVPAMQGNVAVDFWYKQPLVFSLRK